MGDTKTTPTTLAEIERVVRVLDEEAARAGIDVATERAKVRREMEAEEAKWRNRVR